MAYIKKTQSSLGKYVTKPPLTDKLLAKPPFRFLHDIISVLMRDKGIFDGLFTEEELVSDNVKDKDSKIRYLEKALDCVAFASGGVPLAAKPGKIVSGQDPEKTNDFLQALAKLIETGADTSDAVQKVLAGEKPNAKTATAANNNKSPSKNNNNSSKTKNNNNNNNSTSKTNGVSSRRNSIKENGDKNEKNKNSSRERSTSRDAREKSKGSSRDHSRTRSNSSSRRNSLNLGNGRPIQVIEEDQNGDADGGQQDFEEQNMKGSLNPINEQSQEESLPPANQMELEPEPMTNGNGHHFMDQDDESESRPETSGSRRGGGNNSAGSTRPITGYGRKSSAAPLAEQDGEDDNRMDMGGNDLPVLGNGSANLGLLESPTTEPREMSSSSRQQSTRPGSAIKSARPRTGRLKTARPPSARPAAPRLKEKTEIMAEEIMQARPQTGKVSNVIIAGDDDKDEDEDDFLVEEKPKDDLDLKTESMAPDNETMAALAEGGQDHGALVQQILETQKELEDVNKRQQHKGAVEIERESGMTDLSQRREREATQREVDKLKESIQTLTRSANPLGKLMDFLQEDVDSMERELDTWRSENRELKLKLKHEEKITEKSIEPLRAHLIELETAVQEQLDKISVVKANILRNEDRISRMISTIGVGSK